MNRIYINEAIRIRERYVQAIEDIQAKEQKVMGYKKSIEDICVDLPTFHEAIEVLSKELVETLQVRKFVADLNLSEKIKQIKPNGKTLGLITDEITETFFEPNDKLSKLSISLKYEDLIKKEDVEVQKSAQDLIAKIKKLLNLRGEKSAEEGVLQEISD